MYTKEETFSKNEEAIITLNVTNSDVNEAFIIDVNSLSGVAVHNLPTSPAIVANGGTKDIQLTLDTTASGVQANEWSFSVTKDSDPTGVGWAILGMAFIWG